MRLDAHHSILMPPCTLRQHVLEVDRSDHLVKDATELEAVAHVADRYTIGIDHAGQLFERARLADHAAHDQSIQHDGANASRCPQGQQHRSTSMMLVSDSVVGFTSNLFEDVARRGGDTQCGVGTGRSAVGRRKVILRPVFTPFGPAP